MHNDLTTTVLYIDDEKLNIVVFEASFKRRYKVIVAKSGREGLEKLHAFPDIDIVICDMNMPEMNGLEFITLAKKEFPDISFFILSGYCITSEAQAALDKNIILDYFTKPLKVDEIVQAINICMLSYK